MINLLGNMSSLLFSNSVLKVLSTKEEDKKDEKQEQEVPKTPIKISQKIIDSTTQMDHTNQFLHDKHKQFLKSKKMEKPALVLPTMEDFTNETGFVYKVVNQEQGLTKIPIRVSDLINIRTATVPTTLYFDQDCVELFVGDESGFITGYDLR